MNNDEVEGGFKKIEDAAAVILKEKLQEIVQVIRMV